MPLIKFPQRGFMLMEVLVAMLLASVAVLALAGSHASALRLTRMSQHQVQAAQLAADLAERLRANPAGGVADGSASPYQWMQSWTAQQSDALDPMSGACDGAAALCSPVQFAQADMAQWRSLLRRSLPSAAAWVQVDADSTLVQVWVAWRDALPLSADELALGAHACPAGLGVTASQGIRCLSLRSVW